MSQQKLMKPLLNCLNLHVIKKKFKFSTLCLRAKVSTLMKKTYRSPFPALNVKRRNGPVATDIIYYDTSAMCDSSKCAQLFVSTKTLSLMFIE